MTSPRFLSEMLLEVHTVEKYDFLRLIIHSQMIKSLLQVIGYCCNFMGITVFYFFQYGLYSAFMGAFIYTFLGTAKDITLGPTAIMSLLTAAFAASPVDQDPTYAIILCLVCGVVQLLMGVLRLGKNNVLLF